MTSTCLPRVFALAPIGIDGLAIAAAASRAGALGIIDFSFGGFRDLDEGCRQIGLRTPHPFGVRILASDALAGPPLQSGSPFPSVICIPLPSTRPDHVFQVAQLIRGANRIAIADVTTRRRGRARPLGRL